MRQPTFFIPHGGGPCFFMDDPAGMWSRMETFLARFIADLPERPKALLVVSGHWEEPGFAVQDGAKPGLLYDYYGFPDHTYQLRWDAPGAPDVADRAATLLADAGFPTARDGARGWDHGVFVPLKVAVPGADIPTAQLSLRADLDPAAHIAAGRALAPLRDEGVLIVGSGMSFHNMRVRNGDATAPADLFDAALTEAVTDPDPQARDARLAAWEAMPHARFAHPREEHLIPLMVAAGAGADDAGAHVFGDHVIGWKVSGYRFG
ncbi:DODA-type extradiol aromatic ring-opening family dioxygenase [Sphingomonas sp. KC8]|uniref:DODA-type extradiol aromatic ring-opening family dioxygenase n=1 Tax=Sphingomonas sp. KC8 TaxID=1030157 RepID=UPI000248AEA9|nr:class III extradiol ring-cleavage dioxygenase [Sphingomonas sp. KC8]ARS28066.1 catalytic LigB subunit of aromatic ring-opening dioxygenase [Sphingomonas sp. KC8]